MISPFPSFFHNTMGRMSIPSAPRWPYLERGPLVLQPGGVYPVAPFKTRDQCCEVSPQQDSTLMAWNKWWLGYETVSLPLSLGAVHEDSQETAIMQEDENTIQSWTTEINLRCQGWTILLIYDSEFCFWYKINKYILLDITYFWISIRFVLIYVRNLKH